MKKKTPKKKQIKRKPKKPTAPVNKPRTHGEWLECLIRLTERYVKDPKVDIAMHSQTERLKAELDKWKKDNK